MLKLRHTNYIGILSVFILMHMASPQQMYAEGDLKFIHGCHIDLTGDGKQDMVMLVETPFTDQRELIILVSTDKDYRAVRFDANGFFVRCLHAPSFDISKSIDIPSSAPRRVSTPGAYLRLYQPEGAAMAVYWQDEAFHTQWVVD